MSIGRQFKRIGEVTAALALWSSIIWLFSKPKRLLIFLLVSLIAISSIVLMFDDTGETFYVNTNSLELLDRPFGNTKMTLEMNDSLTLVKEMNDNWMKVAVGVDTLYFKDNFFADKELGYTYRIQKTPFSKWKALKGQKVTLNHPLGYFEAGRSMMKNGDEITVQDYSEYDKQLKFKNDGGTFTEIPVEYLQIDWESILENYPKIQ